MGCSTVRCIVQETSEVLWNTLSVAFMPQPSVDDWRNIVSGYQELWHVPHCLGAVDAKLLDVSYKSENDIVLMASCDAQLNFTWMDMATVTDAVNNQIHWQQGFGGQLLNQSLEYLLPEEPLPGTEQQSNFVHSFIADSNFSLRQQLLTPYQEQQLNDDQWHFNHQLSIALAGSINKAFAVLMSRWRVLTEPLRQSPSNAGKIIRAAVVLHNFVKLHDDSYCSVNYLEEVPKCSAKHQVPCDWLVNSQQSLANCKATLQLRKSITRILSC